MGNLDCLSCIRLLSRMLLQALLARVQRCVEQFFQ
jgi:hypothetical protein